ncbi:unnamed protein product, partial [Ilex paraguariensis]
MDCTIQFQQAQEAMVLKDPPSYAMNWNPPTTGTFKVNFSGFAPELVHFIGVGVVIRNENVVFRDGLPKK